MGACVDSEGDGQPDATATGDDLSAGGTTYGTCATPNDDEDGVTIPTLIAGQTAIVVVNSSGTGKLNAFFDWNGDGDFDDAGEALPELAVVAGDNNLSVPVPLNAVTDVGLGARFRLSSNGGLGPDHANELFSQDEISNYLVIAMGDDANIGRAFQMSNSEIGADRKVLSISDDPGYVTDGGMPNLYDVFETRWNTSTDPDSINDAATVFQGVDWSGEVALTSDNGKFDSSQGLVFAGIGIQAVNSNPLVSVSNSKYYDVGVFGPSGPNLSMSIGSGVTTGNDFTALLSELSAWKAFILGLNAEATITNLAPFTNNSASNGSGGLRTTYGDVLDTNDDGIIVVDVTIGINDFNVNNTDWVIDGSGNKLIIFRLRNGSNMLISDSSILLGTGGIADLGLGAIFFSAYEGGTSSDSVFNFNNVVANGVGFWDLNQVGEGGSSINTEIVINNGQGCAQFISQKVNFQNNRWNRCSIIPATPDGEVEDYLVTIIALGKIGDYVWEDLNGNGLQDEPASAGIDGVTVTLYQSNGAFVASTVTTNDGNGDPGYYLFEELLPGDYYLVFSKPGGYEVTVRGATGNKDATDSDPDPASGQTETFSLAPGETDRSWDAGLYRPVRVGDFAWIDTNGNGTYESSSELPLNGVVVQVTNSSGAVVGTAETGPAGGFALGEYLVEGLPPGVYTATVVSWPTGYVPNGPTSQTSIFLMSGQEDLTLDFPFINTTGVGIVSYTATRLSGAMTLRWTTASEIGNAGFSIWRASSASGPWTQVSNSLIPSLAVGNSGASYQWTDATVQAGANYWYQLRSDPAGQVIGPVQETLGARMFLPMMSR